MRRRPVTAPTFEEQTSAPDDNECCCWTGKTLPKGYGIACYEGRRMLAHRYAWERANGPIPAALHVLHKCDNPPCVNVDHLFLGTNADNVADMVRKGRNSRGDTHYIRLYPHMVRRGSAASNTKLTEASAVAIREAAVAGELMAHIAKRINVSISTVKKVLDGKSWTLAGGPARPPKVRRPNIRKDAAAAARRARALAVLQNALKAGDRFGPWTIVNAAADDVTSDKRVERLRWLCRCDCGREWTHSEYQLRYHMSKKSGCKSCVAMAPATRRLAIHNADLERQLCEMAMGKR